jgi:hypothetical protein
MPCKKIRYKSNSQLLALVRFVFRDKFLKHIHIYVPDITASDTHPQEDTGIT